MQGLASIYDLHNAQSNDAKSTLLKFQIKVHLFGNTRSEDAALCIHDDGFYLHNTNFLHGVLVLLATFILLNEMVKVYELKYGIKGLHTM